MATLEEFKQQNPAYKDVPDMQLADALHKKYYSSVPKEEYYQKLGLGIEPEQPKIGRGEAAAKTALQGGTLGFADEIAAGLSAGYAKAFGGEATKNESFKDLYKEARGVEREKLSQAREQYPVQSFVTEIASSIPTGGAALKGLGLAGSGLKTAVKGGAALGAASGLGASEAEDLTGMAKDTALGGLVGGAAGAILPTALSATGTAAKAIGAAPKALIQKVAGITPKSQETLKAFEAAGVSPRLADITQGQTTKTFQNLLNNFPGSRGVIEKATQNQVDDITKQLAGITKSSGGTIQETGKTIQEGAKAIQQKVSKRSNQLYNNLDNYIPKEKGELIPTNNLAKIAQDPQIQDVAAVGAGDTAKVISRYSQIADPQTGEIPYSRLKIFRSTVGAKLQSPSLSGDERGALKKIYGALSNDMKDAIVANGGEKGLQAFNKANNFFKRSNEVLEARINPLVEAKTPEAVYSMAMSGSKQGGTNIRGIMKTLDPEQKQFVQGTITKRMGLANAGEQDATGEIFSPNKFLTEWNKLSPEAKSNIYDKRQVESINNLNKVLTSIKETNKARQSSNNLPYLSWAGLGGLTVANPLAGVGAVGGANLTAKMMTNPKFINWIAQAPKIKPAQIPQHLKQLSIIASQNPEIREDILDFLENNTQEKQ